MASRKTNVASTLAKSELQDKVMVNLMRNWLYKYDQRALMCPRVEPLLKKLVRVLRHLLGEFCYASTPNDLFPIVFLHADKFISSVGNVDQTHLSGILIASLTVTIKFYEDRGIFNSCMAEACGIRLKEVSRMERAFLNQIDFDLMLTTSQINDFFLTHKRTWEERTYFVSSSLSLSSSSSRSSSHISSPSTSNMRPRSATTSPYSSTRPSLLSRNNSAKASTTTPTNTKTNSTLASKSTTITTTKSLIEQQSISSSLRPNKLMRFTKSWKVLSFFKRPSME